MKIITIKRVYDGTEKNDGFRVLGDRLWPRGVAKSTANIDLWVKDAAPSNKLRQWFHADKARRFKEFTKKYKEELRVGSALIEFKNELRGKNKITLVTGVKDVANSHIPTLAKALQKL